MKVGQILAIFYLTFIYTSLIDFSPYSLLLPFLLYAETHYRFRYFFSYLKKSEPEILADAPHRLEPGQPLTLLLLSKDGNHYPATLRMAIARILQNGKLVGEHQLLEAPVTLNTPYWWKVCAIDSLVQPGWIEVDVEFELETPQKTATYKNDNYLTSSHASLRIYKSAEPLPRFPGLHIGDCHTHSTFTEDQVEFGSPLEASLQLCKSMGLSFFCVTDHSYDLDDKLDSYLENDPALPKWSALLDQADLLNQKEKDFAIIQGEEVSCRNAQGQNVHLLLLGNRRYVPGSGDSAERWFRTQSELSIHEVLQTKASDSVAIAAHPREHVPFLQRLLLGRGQWTSEDLGHGTLSGIQFLNGSRDGGFHGGYVNWINHLLKGQRLFAFGGNDAHGNFNRFRQIGIPFFSIRENGQQLFGKARTGVFLDTRVTEEGFLQCLRNGRAIITDGPVININQDGRGKITAIGSTLTGGTVQLDVTVKSSADYGTFEQIRVVKGILGSTQEELIYSNSNVQGLDYAFSLTIEVSQPLYIRAEASTHAHDAYDRESHFAYTNPVWLNPE